MNGLGGLMNGLCGWMNRLGGRMNGLGGWMNMLCWVNRLVD